MPRVIVTKEARKDLIGIRTYLRDDPSNPAVACHIIHELRTTIHNLQYFPDRGKPLDTIISIHTEYRYLPCENYCIFYLSKKEEVYVLRILHQRQDSLKALFRD